MHWEGVLEKSLRLVELLRGVDDPRTEMIAHYRAATAFRVIGDRQKGEIHAAASLPLAERIRDRVWLAQVLSLNQNLFHSNGDWQSARAVSDRGLMVEPMGPALLRTRAAMEYEVGDSAQGEVYLQRLIEAMNLTPAGPTNHCASVAYVIPLVSRISGISQRFDIAERAASAVVSSEPTAPRFSVLARAGLALLAVLRDDVVSAREQYAALQTQGGVMPPGHVQGSGDRLLGLLAHTMGDVDRAAEHFDDALSLCRQAGYVVELAWTCHDYAEMLLQSNGSGSDDLAKSLLTESLEISTQLGMRPLMQRVAALQEQAASQPAKPPTYPDGLTQREVEVLRLVAAGKSNPEIGKELFNSPRTVTTHVSNILNKINAANRAEATGYAVREGLA